MEKTAPAVPEVDPAHHHLVAGISDGIAFGFTKVLRFCADTFFARRYGHRAIVLETVAAVPGMVGPPSVTSPRCGTCATIRAEFAPCWKKPRMSACT